MDGLKDVMEQKQTQEEDESAWHGSEQTNRKKIFKRKKKYFYPLIMSTLKTLNV